MISDETKKAREKVLAAHLKGESEKDVDEKVRQSGEIFRSFGATVEEVSIPMHLLGPAIWTPIGVEGIAQTMIVFKKNSIDRSRSAGWVFRLAIRGKNNVAIRFGTAMAKMNSFQPALNRPTSVSLRIRPSMTMCVL